MNWMKKKKSMISIFGYQENPKDDEIWDFWSDYSQ